MPHNTRAPQMWEIIKPHVEWSGKKVIDLGCGYGNMCNYAASVGAIVTGVDRDDKVIRDIPVDANITGIVADIADYAWDINRGDYDIAFCFSAIPYLGNRNTDALLMNISTVIPLSFLEIQMAGDGPGEMSKDEIIRLLSAFWNNVEEIGHTVVEYRNTERPIWKCWDD